MRSSITIYKADSKITQTLGFGSMAREMPFPMESMDAAEITLSNRYPETDFVMNTSCDMIIRVIKGGVILYTNDNKRVLLVEGATINIPRGLAYYWQAVAETTLFIVSSPPWSKTQQKRITP